MRVLIAPDKFKGALTAGEAAAAMSAGVRDAFSEAVIDLCPMGDGGEGTGAILAERGGFEKRVVEVRDPLGRARAAAWWSMASARAAIVELAEASGIELLTADERDALRTTSYGTGQVIRAALDSGHSALTLCVGGSATVDGGAGCLQGVGCEILDRDEARIEAPLSGRLLPNVTSVRRADSKRFGLRILCDVNNPLLGPDGAAAVFGPQKGASADDVGELERNLSHWASVLERCTGRDVRTIPHGGAAGGVAAGLHAVFNAALTPGAMAVAWDVGLFDRLAGCDLCLTGEGRLDEQTLAGKVVRAVAQLASAQRVPSVALVGAAQPSPRRSVADLAAEVGLADVRVVSPAGEPFDVVLRQTAANLRRAAAEVATGFAAGKK